jgi:hypothetical protein
LHALEVLDAIKSSTNKVDEDSKVIIDDMELKTEFKRGDESNRSHTTKLSPSPDLKSENKPALSFNKNIVIVNSASSTNVEKKPTVKLLNVIPIKSLNSQRETNPLNTYTSTKATTELRNKADRFSPKPKDVKITAMNV